MKTSMNHAISAGGKPGLTLLNWHGEAISSSVGRPGIVRSVKVRALWSVPPANEDLFEYAVATKARRDFWETVGFATLGASAVGALAIAFFGV